MNTFNFRLGKKGVTYASEIAVHASEFVDLRKALPTTPFPWAWGSGIDFRMFLNDELPDCTHAALQGHAEQLWSTRTRRPEVANDDAVKRDFHATGVEQGLTDDNGRYMVGVLGYAKRIGFEQPAGDSDNPPGTREKILGYAYVDHLNLDLVRTCGYLFGGLYVGIGLPRSAMYQYMKGLNWSCNTYPNYSGTPGTWGGHAVWITSMNATGPICATWSGRKQMTWCFWKKYADECYAVLQPDWINALGKAPSGLALTDLTNLLASI